jgi:adenylosuccinate lyase
MPSPLAALSPLDGRYARTAEPLRPYFSEQALIRYRVRIELAWLEALAAERALRELKPFSKKTAADLAAIVEGFPSATPSTSRRSRPRPTTTSRRSSTG